jgi:hypothetical protein
MYKAMHWNSVIKRGKFEQKIANTTAAAPILFVFNQIPSCRDKKSS